MNGIVTHSDGIPLSIPKSSQAVNGHHGSTKPHFPADFYERFFSRISKTWLPSPIRGLMVLEQTPGILSFLAGKPAPSTFPITSISLNVRSPNGGSEETTLALEGNSLTEALQYGATIGHPSLVKWLTEFQESTHSRKIDPSWRISVGAGSQDLLSKIFATLTDPGDAVLIEGPTYAGVLPSLVALGADMIEVPINSTGINTDELEKILDSWPEGKLKPKYLYTVPYGCNPTGLTQDLGTRRKVLALARKHGFLIIEDDPYYLLYYGDEPRPDSYFTLEAQDGHETGIVFRTDSFSKIVSSGLRLGFATGPKPILDRLDLLTSAANLQPCSTSQSILYAVLEHWGHQGLIKHCENVSQFYKERRDVFEAAVQRHLADLVEYTTPVSGMFLWFKLKVPSTDPKAPDGDSLELIRTKALEKGVLALPGVSFFPSGRTTPYVRASFSLLDDESTDEGIRRLAEAVKEAQNA